MHYTTLLKRLFESTAGRTFISYIEIMNSPGKISYLFSDKHVQCRSCMHYHKVGQALLHANINKKYSKQYTLIVYINTKIIKINTQFQKQPVPYYAC